ncbi:MAG: helix-turn-helix domain-containing protein [Deltaproteobacteria bacterium]|nr:helix-turn-helix domain-containing protein [Deltaproteobacteria bacterium]
MLVELVDEKRASELVGINLTTLQFFRRRGSGPAFVKLGRLIRYRIADIEDWIDKNLNVAPT